MINVLSFLPMIVFISLYFYYTATAGSKRYWWAMPVYLVTVVVLFSTLRLYLSIQDTNLIVTAVLSLFSFEMFQMRNHKMSVVFHMFFISAVCISVAAALFYHRDAFIYEFLILLIFFLAESNQRYMKQTYEESAAIYQNMVLTKQVNEVQNIYMTMRGWRHDYHNHLQTLKAYIKMGKIDEAGTYLDSLETDLDGINQLIESGNVNLDAILNSKLSLARMQDIEVHYKAEVPDKLTVSDIDLCVLIGNLIDNAVEACEKVMDMDSHRFIRLYIGVLKKQLYISLTNTTDETVRKFDDEYITSKRGNHGHGLKRINLIVEKYEGYINRKNEPGVFVTEIMLPL